MGARPSFFFFFWYDTDSGHKGPFRVTQPIKLLKSVWVNLKESFSSFVLKLNSGYKAVGQKYFQ